jgi:hypothetical protein
MHTPEGIEMRIAARNVLVGLLVSLTPFPALCAAAAPETAASGPVSRGAIYHIEYLRARPGMEDDYNRFVEEIFRPMLDEMRARGIWIEYRFMIVPYAGPAPCADYTHVFVAKLRNFAALDVEQKAWAEVIRKYHPDEAERRKLFEENLPRIREMVREEILQDFDWK